MPFIKKSVFTDSLLKLTPWRGSKVEIRIHCFEENMTCFEMPLFQFKRKHNRELSF